MSSTEDDQRDESTESGALEPPGEGGREPGSSAEEPAEGSDEILQEEQQGKGYGAG